MPINCFTSSPIQSFPRDSITLDKHKNAYDIKEAINKKLHQIDLL